MLFLTNKNQDGTYSVKDTTSDSTRHFNFDSLEDFPNPIIGVFRDPGTMKIFDLHTVLPDETSKPLLPAINLIRNESIRAFANALRRVIPEYIFSAPASTSGKYHPACDLGNGGLVRHTIYVAKTLVDICSLESTRQILELDDTAIDLMVVACVFHDSLKEGWDNKLNSYSYHPTYAAKMILGCQGFLPASYLDFIGHCIHSHMGQWNTDRNGNEILPKPADKYQWLVHMADYLSARNIAGSLFNNKVYARQTDEVVVVSTPGKKDLTNSEKDKLKSLIEAYNAGSITINPSAKQKYGIERTDEEVAKIWGSILQWGCSEKQIKYLDLAKDLNGIKLK